MRLASKINDDRINATNVLLEMNISEYVEVAKDITKKNEFQRKRVRGASSVYALLKEDLKGGCTIPPIVLAIRIDKLQGVSDIQNISEDGIEALFKAENLIILDGLQRTLTILDLVSELEKKGDTDTLRKVNDNKIRVEIYLGLNKIAILYRMLTLNTGQTPMSIRHQIEILYSDYLDSNFDGIKLFREVDQTPIRNIGEYKFSEVVEGFNSYLDRDELGMNRSEILENIQNLEKLAKENNKIDLFQVFISSYNEFVKKINELTNQWEYKTEEEGEEDSIQNIFGRNIFQIFAKAQPLSGFGAACGKLKDSDSIEGFDTIKSSINQLKLNKTSDEMMDDLINKLKDIKNNAKKIGLEQRVFFTYLFRELFNKDSDSYLKIDQAIESGYRKYKSLI